MQENILTDEYIGLKNTKNYQTLTAKILTKTPSLLPWLHCVLFLVFAKFEFGYTCTFSWIVVLRTFKEWLNCRSESKSSLNLIFYIHLIFADILNFELAGIYIIIVHGFKINDFLKTVPYMKLYKVKRTALLNYYYYTLHLESFILQSWCFNILL